jgi:hypothetical protein
MMPQREAADSMHEPVETSYGRYEGNQSSTHQQFEASYNQSTHGDAVGKIYPSTRDNKNLYRLLVFITAILAIFLFAILAIFFIGGTGGWVSIIVVAFIIFLMSVVVVDKIQ